MTERTTASVQPLLENGEQSSLPRADVIASGFTAVNGDSHSVSTHHPQDPLQTSTAPQDSAVTSTSLITGLTPVQHKQQSHGWRADDRSLSDRAADSPLDDHGDSRKRKRSGSKGDEPDARASASNQHIRPESPKQSMLNNGSATNANTSHDANSSLSQGPTERTRREADSFTGIRRSISSTDRPNYPLPSRPEIEAHLAESLAREFGNAARAQTSDAPSSPVAITAPIPAEGQRQDGHDSESPVRDGDDDQDVREYSPDQAESRDAFDPKRRKRNFSSRTKTGCHTCRSRKKKCDEGKPTCRNCHRGGFACGGYGPKSIGPKITGPVSRTTPVVLQSKQAYEPSHGPASYYPNPMDDGPRYDHWGNVPTEQEYPHHNSSSGHPSHRGSWPRQAWPSNLASHQHVPERPPPDYPHIPPVHAYPPNYKVPPPPLPPPIPPPIDPSWIDNSTFTPYGRPTTGHSNVLSGRSSGPLGSSHPSASLSTSHLSEKEKMLRGEPFRHYNDDLLVHERKQCKGALERYNDAARTSTHISPEERGRLFRAVMIPSLRPAYPGSQITLPPNIGPEGHVGIYTMVETPFNCDYGYNITLGENVLIESGCYMQDICEITIGDRTIIGPNVKIYGLTADVDANVRKGCMGNVRGGAVKIGEDCFIGGDVTILPFRKIGKGAVIGASSVVTKDVKEYTVVAGNPAKVIRRIEPGPNVNLHHPDIQEQNDRMQKEMVESADRRRRQQPGSV